jgi:hypothetical protein
MQSNGGSQSSVNSASRGARFTGNHGSSGGRGRGNGGRGRGTGGRGRGANAGQRSRFTGCCQVCGKDGHSAITCWHRFDATMLQMRRPPTPPLTCMVSIETGILIPGQPITSPASSTG